MTLLISARALTKKIQSRKTIGLVFFQVGVLFLASAPSLSFLLLIIASIIGSIKREDKFLHDKFNRPLILASILMVANCLFISMGVENFNISNTSLAWIGLLNWVPFFWCFWSFQIYLDKAPQRLQTARLFIIGSMPILFSGFTQYFLNWYGPYQLFNKLIIWYQRPLLEESGITSLFNNYNYAGAWLGIVLPLCVTLLIKDKNKISQLIISIIIFSFIYMIILTTSRNALISIAITSIILAPIKKFKIYFFSFFLGLGLSLINIIPLLSLNLQNLIFEFIPSSLLQKTSINALSNITTFPRVEIWTKALKLIKSNPFIGYGGGSFSDLYNISEGKYESIQHTHNILLEIAFNYGLPCAILIVGMIFFILFKNIKLYFFKRNIDLGRSNYDFFNFNKAWITSFLIFFFLHMFDITYYDGRISILAWILLAGMRQIIKENNALDN